MKALILGASGLVGYQLLNKLVKDARITQITCLLRSKIDIENDKLKQLIVNYDHLEKWESEFRVDLLFCCLGTTIKKAGSKQAFKQVDYHYIIKSAKCFSKMSDGHFILISSIGADKESSIFYSQIKGETEEVIKTLNMRKLTIIRPSILLGNRKESRPVESIGQAITKQFNCFFQGGFKKYRGVEASEVADLMLTEALGDECRSFIEVERV